MVEIASGAWQPPGTEVHLHPGDCRVAVGSSQYPAHVRITFREDNSGQGEELKADS